MERIRRTILFVIAVSLVSCGGLAFAWFVDGEPQPVRHSAFDRVPEVSVMSVAPSVAAQPVVSYGTVRPQRQVKIVPQVSGALVFVNNALETGKRIAKGELLFEIDPVVYDARVRQAEAEVKGLQAALHRGGQEQASLVERLANAEQMLAIDEGDFQAGKQLYDAEHVGTQRDVDMLYQEYLRTKDGVIDLRSRLAIVPHAQRETQARLDAATARLEQSKHDLDNTKILCPFDARVEFVSAYTSQVVTAYFSIATLTDMSAFELVVGVNPGELRWLDEALQPAALRSAGAAVDGPVVKVSWSLRGQNLTWRGRVTRFERVDEATRTARLVVEVRDVDMVATVSEGDLSATPTISIGMHCRAELPTKPLEGALLVAKRAVYDHRFVYVFEPDAASADGRVGRLARREVPLLRTVGDSVLVDYAGRTDDQLCELKPGELVVVSPLARPVVGMEIRRRPEHAADRHALIESDSDPSHPQHRGRVARLASNTSGQFDWSHGER